MKKKRNNYYQTMFRRSNMIKEIIFGLFFSICSWPRLLLEVFLRRNMGERYYSFSTTIFLIVVLVYVPYWYKSSHSYYGGGDDFWSFVGHNLTWYIFLGLFLMFSLKRRHEVKSLPSVWDGMRFSLSNGESLDFFYSIEVAGQRFNTRTIVTYFEPLPFLIGGIILFYFGQLVGMLFIVCSIIYSLSYMAAYHMGDHFIMDKIDEMICSEELANSFVENMKPSQTRGFSVPSRKPADPNFRRKVADTFFEDGEEIEVV